MFHISHHNRHHHSALYVSSCEKNLKKTHTHTHGKKSCLESKQSDEIELVMIFMILNYDFVQPTRLCSVLVPLIIHYFADAGQGVGMSLLFYYDIDIVEPNDYKMSQFNS
jgi:hypothetical protein